MSDLTPEKSARPAIGDLIHLAARMVLGYRFGVGVELFNFLIKPKSESRADQWREAVVRKFSELENSTVTVEQLQNSDQFATVVMEASLLAMRTHHEEKLEALRNAVVNTALNISIDESLQHVFLQLVGEFTPWHIRLLHFFNNPMAWFHEHNTQPPSMVISGSRHRLLEVAYPEIVKQEEFLQLVLADLKAKRLADIELKLMMTGPGAMQPATTELGRQFIKYISASSSRA